MENVRVRWGLEDVTVGDDHYGVGEERVAANVLLAALDGLERVPLIGATRNDAEGEEWAVRGKWSRRVLKQHQSGAAAAPALTSEREPTRVST